MYREGDAALQPPVRIDADGDRDLLVLRSDVPVGPDAAGELAACLSGWFDDLGVTPIGLSGIPEETEASPPALYGLGIGAGVDAVSDAGIDAPDETGVVSGPTGVLLNDAVESGRTAVGLVVESDPRFPDPEAARVLIKEGIEPLTGVDIPVDHLMERAEQIRSAKERLAKRIQDASQESTQARPLGIYTLGCNCVKISDTPGCRNTSRDYSRQYTSSGPSRRAAPSRSPPVPFLHV